MEWREGDYLLTTDPARADVEAVHASLTTAYWSEGIPLDVVRRAIAGSIPFSVWWEPASGGVDAAGRTAPAQVGFARAITDRATFAYVADVYVLPEHRGRGLSKWMMRAMVAHPDLQGLRRWVLATRDAHELYRKFGFTPLAIPDRWMERWDKDVYRR